MLRWQSELRSTLAVLRREASEDSRGSSSQRQEKCLWLTAWPLWHGLWQRPPRLLHRTLLPSHQRYHRVPRTSLHKLGGWAPDTRSHQAQVLLGAFLKCTTFRELEPFRSSQGHEE